MKKKPLFLVAPLIGALLIALSLASCSTAKRKTDGGSKAEIEKSSSGGARSISPPPEVLGPPDPIGPVPLSAQPPGQAYGPEPIEIRPVVLVLGPGLARGFAYAGILRALHDEKIPVGAIVGTEMGALIGGLYGMSSTINGFEWSLVKFKEDLFLSAGGIFSSLLNPEANTGKLNETLQHEFGLKDLKESKIPVQIILRNEKGSNTFIVDHGSVSAAIRGALGLTGFIAPSDWSGEKVTSSGAGRPFGVSEARLLGIGPVVVVDVLRSAGDRRTSDKSKSITDYVDAARNTGLEELKAADMVITPDLGGIDFLDFEKKNDIIFRGQNAIVLQRTELRHLVGLPPNNEDPAP